MTKGLKRSLSRGSALRRGVIKQTLTFSESVDITGVAATVDFASIVIGDFPEGNILLLGAVAYVGVGGGADAHIIDNWDGDYAIGTVATIDEDVADAGEADIVASTAISAGASDKTAPLTRGTTEIGANDAGVVGKIFDNTDGSLEMNLNLLIDDNVITDTEDGTFLIEGDLHLAYIVLGDD